MRHAIQSLNKCSILNEMREKEVFLDSKLLPRKRFSFLIRSWIGLVSMPGLAIGRTGRIPGGPVCFFWP